MIKDSDGHDVKHGDTITFSYGIPPVGVTAKIEARNMVLWVLTPDHNPKECKLIDLRGFVGDFYLKHDVPKDQPHKLHRTNASSSSQDAARKISASQMKERVLMAIVDAGDRGITANELLPLFPGAKYSSITARPSQLHADGLIYYKKNDERDGSRVMRATSKGFNAIRQKQNTFDDAVAPSNALPGMPESF